MSKEQETLLSRLKKPNPFYFDSIPDLQPDFRYCLLNLKKGSCDDYTTFGAYIFRSVGIPTGIDFIPQWADRSLGHDWNVLNAGNGWKEDYSFGAYWDTIGGHLKVMDGKAGKIFRKTFAKQSDSPAMQNKYGEVLPPTFCNPCIKDVSGSYLDCMDVTVNLTKSPPGKRKYVYLCNFNNHDWIPVHWGEIKGGKAIFTKMGKDIAYLPVYYAGDGIQPAADPFILTKAGEIKKLIPDHSKTQTLILKRKYKPGDVPKKGELLLGGRFQVANREDFSDSLTVYTVDTLPEILFNSVNLTLKKPYRYFRFLSAPNTWGGEISEIEVYSTESEAKLTGKVIGNKNCPQGWEAENAFDGDPLTSYQCVWGEQGWVGLDFEKPVNIARFRYLPRNDDNFINALFWLRNLTKGKEERIFTYENNQQVWW